MKKALLFLTILAAQLVQAVPQSQVLSELGVNGVTDQGGSALYSKYLVRLGTNGTLALNLMPSAILNPAWSRICYVDPIAGSDAPGVLGAPGTPYQTLQHAMTTYPYRTNSGVVYYLGPGTYDSVTIDPVANPGAQRFTLYGVSPVNTVIPYLNLYGVSGGAGCSVAVQGCSVTTLRQGNNRPLTLVALERSFIPTVQMAYSSTCTVVRTADAQVQTVSGIRTDVLLSTATNVAFNTMAPANWPTIPSTVAQALETLAGRPAITPGANAGDLLYWSGSYWTNLQGTANNQLVLFGGAVPTFRGLTSDLVSWGAVSVSNELDSVTNSITLLQASDGSNTQFRLGSAVNYATNAGLAVSAGIASYATNAGMAVSAGIAGFATNATMAQGCPIAGFATNANYATTAGSAASAASATTANYANSAGSAASAATATHAIYADSAGAYLSSSTNAYFAIFAGYATNAGYADQAGYATNAGYAAGAAIASFATNAGSVAIAAYATNAGSVAIAAYATNAGYAAGAAIASYATNAGSVAIAAYATNAGYATVAGTASNAVGATTNHQPLVYFGTGVFTTVTAANLTGGLIAGASYTNLTGLTAATYASSPTLTVDAMAQNEVLVDMASDITVQLPNNALVDGRTLQWRFNAGVADHKVIWPTSWFQIPSSSLMLPTNVVAAGTISLYSTQYVQARGKWIITSYVWGY